jgi:hypothetical protein
MPLRGSAKMQSGTASNRSMTGRRATPGDGNKAIAEMNAPTAIKRDLPHKESGDRSRTEMFVSLGRMASFQ